MTRTTILAAILALGCAAPAWAASADAAKQPRATSTHQAPQADHIKRVIRKSHGSLSPAQRKALKKDLHKARRRIHRLKHKGRG
jgi:Spy/CpxP family protein refolding chaperone